MDIATADSISGLGKYGIESVSAAIGIFDGVHRGHRLVLAETLRVAGKTDSIPAAVTFDPHPRSIVSGTPPELLIPLEERIRLLGAAGMKAVVVIHFDREFSRLSPADFLDQCLHSGKVSLKGICVGRSWRFGREASGSAADIEKMSEKDSFAFSPVPELTMDGTTVSSTFIRAAVAKGDLAAAGRMLGRRYSIWGKVVHGFGIADKRLGYPTANIDFSDCVLPPYGAYAVFALVDGRRIPAVASVGIAPTVRSGEKDPRPKIEVHLLDTRMDLYGKRIGMELVAPLRPEMRFASTDDLKRQIAQDASRASAILMKG